MYPLFLALRYARSRAVTYLALFTVALSVASFVVVMSVMAGFRHKVEEIIQDTGAPLEIYCGGSWGIDYPDELAARLKRVKGVRGASPYRRVFVLVRSPRYSNVGQVRGVDLARELRYGRLEKYLYGELPEKRNPEKTGQTAPRSPPPKPGRPKPTSFKLTEEQRETLKKEENSHRSEAGTVSIEPPPEPPRGHQGAIIGAAGARHLGLRYGSILILTTQGPEKEVRPGKFVKELRSRKFMVIGFYQSDTDWLNELILIDRAAAQDLAGSDVATGISIWLDDNREMMTVRDHVKGVFQEDRLTQVRTWRESRPEIFGFMDIQDRVMMIILLVFFVMTGAFIMAILWVLVSDKTRDIGTLRALGAGRLGVVLTFVSQGLAIAVGGVAIGMGLGLLLTENINPIVDFMDATLAKLGAGQVFGSISRELFVMEKLPIDYDPVHLVSMVVVTVGVSFLASLLPAVRAACLHPVEALRHE